MKTICGLSTRGAAYFAASMHICIGLLFFILFMDRVVHQVYYKSFSIEELGVDKESIIYFGFLFPLGVLIFKAVDKEDKIILKWASIAFILLQVFGMLNLMINFGKSPINQLFTSLGSNKPHMVSNIAEHLKYLALDVLSTTSYIITLYLYGRQLEYFPAGRIYTHHHHQGAIPLYATGSPFFNDPRESRGMTTPFGFNFDPPPPYSSNNNIAQDMNLPEGNHFIGMLGSGPPNSGGIIQQQPCSSSRSVFHNIGRIGHITFKKHSRRQRQYRSQSHALCHPTIVSSHTLNAHNLHPNQNIVNDLSRSDSTSSNTTNPTNPSESDSPSAPLLEARRNDLDLPVFDGCNQNNSNSRVLNLKEEE